MGSNLRIISILLSVIKFDVISAWGESIPSDCESYEFFGNCNKEDLCFCYSSPLQWYRTSFAGLRSFTSEFQSFSDICGACSSLEPGKCINQTAYLLITTNVEHLNVIQQITDTQCSQMLTVSQTTTISTTTGGQDMTSTAYTTLSTNEQTTHTEASVTGVSQTTTLSTATTGGQGMTSTAYTTTSTNEQTTRSETSSSYVSQTTTVFMATGAQDMTSTAYTTLSTNKQTTRTEASVTGATTGGEDMTSTAYTTTSTNEQTTRSETSSTDAMCPCQCEYFDKIEYWAQESNQRKQYEELSKKLAEIKDILKLETKNLSSFVNKKISAADDRPSAVATGFLGAGIITIVLAGIVLLDLPVIIQQARFLFRDIKRMCVRAQ